MVIDMILLCCYLFIFVFFIGFLIFPFYLIKKIADGTFDRYCKEIEQYEKGDGKYGN